MYSRLKYPVPQCHTDKPPRLSLSLSFIFARIYVPTILAWQHYPTLFMSLHLYTKVRAPN
jgi:hypothetical protein